MTLSAVRSHSTVYKVLQQVAFVDGFVWTHEMSLVIGKWLTPYSSGLCCFFLSTELAFSSWMLRRMMCPSRIPEHQCRWRVLKSPPTSDKPASRCACWGSGFYIIFPDPTDPKSFRTLSLHLTVTPLLSQSRPDHCSVSTQNRHAVWDRWKPILASLSLPVNWGHDCLFDHSMYGNIKGD